MSSTGNRKGSRLKGIDIQSIIEWRDTVAGLTKFDFSLYDNTGFIAAPPLNGDPIERILSSSKERVKEQEGFIKTSIEKAIIRKGVSIFKGPLNQYRGFIPAPPVNDTTLVLVGNAFFASDEDIAAADVDGVSVSRQDLKSWAGKIAIRDMRTISEAYGRIQRLFHLFVKESYEKHLSVDKYRKMKTIADLLSDLDHAVNEESAFNLLSETISFLFGGDTVSLMARKGDQFTPVFAVGRLREKVESVSLKPHGFISEAVRNLRPFSCAESIDLLRLGYTEDISSIHIFPFPTTEEASRLLCVFNSQFSKDDVGCISILCNLTGFLLRNINSRNAYVKYIRDLAALNLAAVKLSPAFQNPDTLYESIVDVSTGLMSAERGSIMLPEEEGTELLIRAVKGINKWMAKNIRVKIGEGIAGRVYKEGKPLISSDIGRHLLANGSPGYKTNSFVSLPLRLGDETIGVLNIADKVGGEVFSEADMEFIRYFASYATIAIKGSHYYCVSEEMRTLSITDSLTGLFNRRYFDERLFEELQRAIRYDSMFSLAIFDIDDFKLYNDSEGHLAGDEVLKTIADISRESLRSIDILARYGGEEFSIIMPQTDRDDAFLVAERVRKNISELMPLSWKDFPRDKITVSIGIATFTAEVKDAKTLIKNADRALYKAKMAGKNKTAAWEAFNPNGKGNASP